MFDPWRSLCPLLLVLFIYIPNERVLAQAAFDGDGCWSRPQPETIEEAFKIAGNQGRGRERRKERAVLLLSGGALKAAYGAGLLVGWQETGKRPEFAAVTAVGVSALIAPFAFIGPKGDKIIGDIFNCSANSLTALAERAAASLTADIFEAIAREHESGRRLFVALPGSAGREEAVWDMGRLAASRHPKASAFAKKVLLASIDMLSFVNPKEAPVLAGEVVKRNFAFREEGTGEPFLFPPDVAQISGKGVRYYLVHNGFIAAEESADYIRTRAGKTGANARALVPAYDVIRHSLATSSGFRVASIKPKLGFAPQAQFDMDYLRALFLHAYRQARMGKEWKSTFPGMEP